MVYHRNETNLHNVPNAVPSLMMIDFFACLISTIVLIIGLFGRNKTAIIVSCSILAVGMLASIFCDNYFNWYINCTYDLSKKNKLIYSFNLNGVSVSQNKTVVTISDVSKFKVKGNKISIKGCIEKRAPLRQVKTLKKIDIPFDFDDDAKAAVLERLNAIKI